MIFFVLLLASGKHTKSYWTWWFIVDLPIKNGGSFQFAMWLFTRGYYWSITQNYPNLPQKRVSYGHGPVLYVMESILFEIHKRVKNRDRSGTNRFCCDVYAPMITRVSCVFFLRYRRCFHHLSAYGVAQDLKLENICFCEKSPSSTHAKAVLENPAAALASTLLWLVVLAYHHMVIYGVCQGMFGISRNLTQLLCIYSSQFLLYPKACRISCCKKRINLTVQSCWSVPSCFSHMDILKWLVSNFVILQVPIIIYKMFVYIYIYTIYTYYT